MLYEMFQVLIYLWIMERELESIRIPSGTMKTDRTNPKEKFRTLTIARAVPVSSNAAM